MTGGVSQGRLCGVWVNVAEGRDNEFTAPVVGRVALVMGSSRPWAACCRMDQAGTAMISIG